MFADRRYFSRTIIAVVGGGASGTLVAIDFLRRAGTYPTGPRFDLYLIDRAAAHGAGVAYNTSENSHLLNTTTSRMSAIYEDVGHFTRWADSRELRDVWGEFLPRHFYAQYLRETLKENAASAGQVRMRYLSSEVVRIVRRESHDGFVLLFRTGQRLLVDRVVLATGNLPPKPLGDSLPRVAQRIIENPWRPGALQRVIDGKPLLIVGTGLTMADVVQFVAQSRSNVPILAVSRHGLLPQAHAKTPGETPPLTLPREDLDLEKMRAFLCEQSKTTDCRNLVDGLRTHTQRLWRGFSEADQRTFVAKWARLWDSYRFRMPPAVAQTVTRLRDLGEMRVRAATVVDGQMSGNSTKVFLRAEGVIERAEVGRIINCTGPPPRIAETKDALICQLLADGLAVADRLGLGISATDEGIVRGQGEASEDMFVIGPPRKGELWETLAIWEIREQARSISHQIHKMG